MADLIKGKKKAEEVKPEVLEIVRKHREVKYGFQSLEEAVEWLKEHSIS
jgi:hypothetical protein